ncbi:MAG: hypothetical protein GF331_20300 [Chitinivibrionales bacterium]|nr:hypothetical protein [Chitinivibrionales bacterium]
MLKQLLADVRHETIDLIRHAGVSVTEEELAGMALVDFGMHDIRREGVQLVDILLTDELRITVLVLLPNQTLPEHMHPAYGNCPGKEETVRVVYGECRVYVPGLDTMQAGFLPSGKEAYYTARNEAVLRPVQTFTVEPGMPHWFQAGPQGCVTYGYYNRVDESQNVFTDPNVTTKCGPGAVQTQPLTAAGT